MTKPRARRLAATLALLVPCASFAADSACPPAPLGDRVLTLRGTVNDWRADDETAFR